MTVSQIHDSEARLASLRRLGILDTPAEPSYDDLVQLAALVCDTPIALISLVDEDRQWFKARIGLSVEQTPRSMSFCSHAIREKRLFVVPDTREDKRFRENPLVTGDPDIRFYAGVPVAGPDGFPLGTLCVIDRKPRELTPEQKTTLRVLARQVEAQFKIRQQVRDLQEAHAERSRPLVLLEESQEKLREANARLRQLANTDSLTGVCNRRAFDEALQEAWSFSGRIQQSLSLLMVDVDHFKRINDDLGHEAGDEVLKVVVRTLERNLRSTDHIFRYGGEEFAVLLPATDGHAAMHVAELLRQSVRSQRIACRDLTVSIGVAADMADPEGAKDCHLVASADRALYEAKAVGRNRVIEGRVDPENQSLREFLRVGSDVSKSWASALTARLDE